jgi:hypothetical protein
MRYSKQYRLPLDDEPDADDGKVGKGAGRPSVPASIPELRKERPSGIWRKINPQRQAECEVKRDAGCECNGGCIHSLFLIFLCTAVRCRASQRMELGL